MQKEVSRQIGKLLGVETYWTIVSNQTEGLNWESERKGGAENHIQISHGQLGGIFAETVSTGGGVEGREGVFTMRSDVHL